MTLTTLKTNPDIAAWQKSSLPRYPEVGSADTSGARLANVPAPGIAPRERTRNHRYIPGRNRDESSEHLPPSLKVITAAVEKRCLHKLY